VVTVLAGIHPLREALLAGLPLERIVIARGAAGARVQEIVALARERDIPIRFEPREALDRLAPRTPHQGVAGFLAAQRFADLDDLAAQARLLVLLDGVEDPRNLGAILRTAYAAGAGGVVIPQRRSAPVNDAVAKASAGAIAHLPVARVANLNRALETLKERGWWTYGFEAAGRDVYDRVDYAPRAAMVFGGEGRGLHEQVRRKCDHVVRIPLAGKLASLNVSVAVGVALFDWKRRGAGEPGQVE
jgi:23S rRNA (guanosine2251-2'-O)-methyltransferase